MASDAKMIDAGEQEKTKNYLARFGLVDLFNSFKDLNFHELAKISNKPEELTRRGVTEDKFEKFKKLYDAYEEDRTSRFGAMKDVLGKLSQMNVLIIGCRGVGVETAKNLILTGPKAVTIWDPATVSIADLGANFYLRKEHVGQTTRAQACQNDLQTLNSRVTLSLSADKLSESFLKGFQSVVVTEFLPKSELVRINEVCRSNGIQFIFSVNKGVQASIFCDYGDEHLVTDPDGIPTNLLVIEDISEEGVVIIGAGRPAIIDSDTGDKAIPHGLDDGDLVKVEDLEGYPATDGKKALEELNGQVLKVKRIYQKLDGGKRTKNVVNKLQLVLPDGLEWSQFAKRKAGGIINEQKKEKTMKFLSFAQTLRNPCPPEGNWALDFFGPFCPDQNQWQQKQAGKDMHLAIAAVLDFQAENERWPGLHNMQDANKVVEIAKKINDAHKAINEKGEKAMFTENLNEARVRNYALYWQVELTGFCAFLGGMTAQEICKMGGKYTPVHQWLHTDDQSLIGDEVPSDAAPRGTRYDHQIAVFGQAFQQKMASQKIFLVGCGALGCEYMKAISLMGIGTGAKGKVWATDMDCIEVSNLSRQFLFRSEHVGKAKSLVAAETAKAFNPAMRIEPLEEKVWEGTEDKFDDGFWEDLTLCWNALDNVHARKYTDRKCLWYGKPLLESGTMGTMTNSEIVLPFKTKSYNDGVDPEPEGIAMCTLRSFPHLPLHCIEWAKVQFGELFELFADSFNMLIENKDKFFESLEEGDEGDATSAEVLGKIKRMVDVQLKGVDFRACVDLAFDEYIAQYRNRIQDLIYLFPEDARVTDKDSGEDKGPFWSGHKRFPEIAKESGENFLDYLYATANLFAFMFGIPQERNREAFDKTVASYGLKAPEWKPNSNLDKKALLGEDDDEKDGAEAGVNAEAKALEDFLRGVDVSKLKPVEVADFEKDDDTNFHIDYITIAANMRAFNYRIKQSSRHECKVVAGKIIAALATTTAMITGLVTIEFYKLMLGLQFVHQDKFYNANINLAVPEQTQFFAPDAALRQKKSTNELGEEIVPYPEGYTSWDKLEINAGKDLTIGELVESFPDLFWEIEPQLLFKFGLTKEEIKEGKGIPLFSEFTANPQLNMAKMMVKREATSAEQKKRFQAIIDQDAKSRAENDRVMNMKVSERYAEIYGDIFPSNRNYIVLDGAFEDADGNLASLPYIKYVYTDFKNA